LGFGLRAFFERLLWLVEFKHKNYFNLLEHKTIIFWTFVGKITQGGQKGLFFRETLEALNRSSDVGDPF
jgi:hypothetical protein